MFFKSMLEIITGSRQNKALRESILRDNHHLDEFKLLINKNAKSLGMSPRVYLILLHMLHSSHLARIIEEPFHWDGHSKYLEILFADNKIGEYRWPRKKIRFPW